jgi:hypothetical protein
MDSRQAWACFTIEKITDLGDHGCWYQQFPPGCVQVAEELDTFTMVYVI